MSIQFITGYLVYRPAHDYEESITPYFVCLDRRAADKAAATMNTFLDRVAQRIPDVNHDLDPDAWVEAYEARESALARVRWPFGVDLRNDIQNAAGQTTVAVMPIRVAKPL